MARGRLITFRRRGRPIYFELKLLSKFFINSVCVKSGLSFLSLYAYFKLVTKTVSVGTSAQIRTC